MPKFLLNKKTIEAQAGFIIMLRLSGFVYFFALVSCTSPETRLQQFLLKGNVALEGGNKEQATYYYRQAIALDPCFADALNNLGTLAFRSQNFDQAVDFYTQAIACNSGFWAAYYNRAHARFERKEYFGALADVEKIESVQPDTVWIDFTRGLIFTRMRQFHEAKASFNRALKKSGVPSADLLVNRATLHYYLKQYDSALLDLEAAQNAYAAEANIYNTRAMIYAERNELSRALDESNRALALAPRHAYYLNNRGYIYLMMGDLKRAETDINESISIDPYNGWAYRNKGIFYLLTGEAASAERVLKQALDRDPFIDRIHYYLGQAYLKNNKSDLACAAFDLSDKANENRVTAADRKQCR